MKQKLIWVLLLCHALCANAQNIRRVQGYVSRPDGEILAGATIQTDEQILAYSDTNGYFEVVVSNTDKVLTARLIGYFPKRIQLDSLNWQGGIARTQFLLTPAALPLEEVTISSTPVTTIFKEDFATDLMDYLFVGPDLLLLVREKNKFYLRLTDEAGAVRTELRMPNDALKQLHRSCTGAWHVVGQQWAWEITMIDGHLDTFPRYPARNFHQIIEPCVAKDSGYYFISKMTPFKQSMQYHYIDPAGKRDVLINISDSLAEKMAWNFYSDFRTKRLFILPPTFAQDPTGPFNVQHPEFATQNAPVTSSNADRPYQLEYLMQFLNVYNNDQLASLSALETLRQDSIYAPMFRIKNAIYLFNHTYKDLMVIHTHPWKVEHIPLLYHLEKSWRKEVIVDEITHKTYGRFLDPKKGCILKEIDLNTGLSSRQYILYPVPYLARKYMMRNGVLYYIGQPDVNTPNHLLYRAQISHFEANMVKNK